MQMQKIIFKNLVGAPRFELGTPCAQGRCATRLRYAPMFFYTMSERPVARLRWIELRIEN